MQISRRDRNLLILLAVFAALAAYYYFGIMPQEDKIETLETELALKEAAKSEIELKLASEFNLDKRIEELEAQISVASDKYFGILTQEEILMLVTRFGEGSEITFSDMTFSDIFVEGSQLKQTMASLSFDGNYESLMAYLRNTRTFDKQIVVKEMVIQNQLDQGLVGKMQLEFNGIPAVEAYSVPYKKLVTSQFNTRDLSLGPFAPYDNFVAVQPTEAATDGGTVIIPDPNEYYPGEPVPGETVVGGNGTGSGTGTPYRPMSEIYGFEDSASFFVGNNLDITGFIAKSKMKVAGGYSTEVNFDFVTGRELSEANVVFDTTPVMINKQADSIGLWVYAYEASNHAIGVVIIDSKGKEYRVPLTESVDFTQWQEIDAALPVEITYPCMIQRIYIEGKGYDQKLTGKYLFDRLQVSYSVR
jgi:type IV pilus assembly protein PilO